MGWSFTAAIAYRLPRCGTTGGNTDVELECSNELDRRTYRALTKMWAKGATASQIADELGGVSRNAVIGKAHRLGLKARPSPVKADEEKDEPRRPAAPAAPKAAAPAEAEARPPRSQPTTRPRRRADGAGADAAEPAAAQPAQPNAAAVRSVGPGGFLRQGPGDKQAPIPPAPPRRLVPAKPSPEIADKTSLLDLNDRVCRWPMGHPGEPDFHFCGEAGEPRLPLLRRALRRRLPGAAAAPRPPAPAAAAVRRAAGPLSLSAQHKRAIAPQSKLMSKRAPKPDGLRASRDRTDGADSLRAGPLSVSRTPLTSPTSPHSLLPNDRRARWRAWFASFR